MSSKFNYFAPKKTTQHSLKSTQYTFKHCTKIHLRSVARLSRVNGKITDLLESFKNFSAHNDQICLRLSKSVTHVLKMVLD